MSRINSHSVGWSLVAVLCIPVFLGSLDLLVVSAFLPEVIREIGLPLDAAGQEAAAWLVNGYLIAYSIALLAVGRLSDLIGWRSALTICLGLYFLGSILVINYPVVASVLSPLYGVFGIVPDPAHASLHAIILARVIAAFGAGALASVALSLVSQAFHADRRALALGIIAAMDTIGWMFGGFWGGVVVQFSNWRTVFIINMPLIVLTLFLLRRQLRGVEQQKAEGRFDLLGFVLATVALVAVNIGIAQISTDEAGMLDVASLWTPLAVAAVAFAIFIGVELRQRHPLVQLRHFRQRKVVAANVINVLIGCVLLLTLLTLPLFTNVRETGRLGLLLFFSQFSAAGLRDAALIQGMLIGAFAVPLAISSVIGGWLHDRFGARMTTALGVIIAVLGVGLFSQSISLTTSYVVIAIAGALTGFGIGMTFTPIIVLLLDAVSESERGSASALVLSLRMVAMSITTSFTTAFITQRTIDLVRITESPNALLDMIPPSQYAASPFATAYIGAVNAAIGELFIFALIVLVAAFVVSFLLSDPRRGRVVVPAVAVIIALCIAPLASASAQENADRFPYVQRAASHLPADVEFFAVAQTDPDAIGSLDRVLARVSDRLALDPQLTVLGIIEEYSRDNPLIARLSLLQPYIHTLAVGIDGTGALINGGAFGENGTSLTIVGFSDLMPLINPIAHLLFGDLPVERRGDYDVFVSPTDPTVLALGADHLIFSQGETEGFDVSDSLANDTPFQDALRDLPRENYGAVAYGELTTVLPLVRDRLFSEMLTSLSFSPTTNLMMGLALDETDGDLALIADLAQSAATSGALPTLHPDFARFAPADTPFLVQSASVGALIRTIAGLYASISVAETQESALALLEGFSQQVLELSLTEEILPALTGDYLLAVDYRAVDLLANAATAPFPAEFSLVMEADTPGNAAKLVGSLYGAARLFLQTRSDVTFQEADHSIQIGTLDVIFGSDERIVYFGTRAFVQQGLAQHSPLSQDDDFLATTRLMLPSPHALALLSARGFGELAMLSLNAATDPSVGILPSLLSLNLPQINPSRFYSLTQGGLISISTTPDGSRLIRLALRIN